MHMADALVAPVVAATMYLASGTAGGYSIRRVRMEDDAKKIPLMGVMGALRYREPALRGICAEECCSRRCLDRAPDFLQ